MKKIIFTIGIGVAAIVGISYIGYRGVVEERGEEGEHGPIEREEDQEETAEEGIHLSEEAKKVIGLRVVPAERRTMEKAVQVTGVISPQPNQEAFVSSRISGKVERIYVNLGEAVKKGQLLAELRSVELETLQVELHHALGILTVKEADLTRVKNLVEKGISASKELLRAHMEYHNAEREVEGIKRKLSVLGLNEKEIQKMVEKDTYIPVLPILAPISGQIVDRDVTIGETIDPQHKMFHAIDLSAVLAEGDVAEDKIHLIRKGQEVRIKVSAYPEDLFHGRIDYVSDKIEPEKRTVHVWARVENPDHRLKPGMFARLVVILDKNPEALSIPVDAVLSTEGENFVFVENGDHYEKATVILGAKNDQYVEVVDGLFPGSLVVTEGKRQVYTQYLAEKGGGISVGQAHPH